MAAPIDKPLGGWSGQRLSSACWLVLAQACSGKSPVMPEGPEQHTFISYSSGSRKPKLQKLPIWFLVGVLFPVCSHSYLLAVSFHVGGGG